MKLPPGARTLQIRLTTLLRHIPPDSQDDAIQEAWLAYLQGKDVIRSVDVWRKREQKARNYRSI